MMKRSGWLVRSLVALAPLCAAERASTADLGFYIVMDGTSNTVDISMADFNYATWNTVGVLAGIEDQPIDVGLDMKSKNYNITVGYQLGSYFAIEGSYVDFGKLTYDFTYPGGTNLQGRWKVKSRGPTVAAVGLLPLGPYFSLDARAGFVFLDNKHDISINGDGVGFSDSKTSLYYGAGAAWWITGQVALRLGYNNLHRAIKYQGIFDQSFFKRDATQYTLGIRYSYGY
jgi:opacity protein-like surface antigen